MRYILPLAAIAITAFLSISGPGYSTNYTIYYQSELDSDSIIYKYDASGPIPATQPGCVHPSVTSNGSMLFYSRIAETAWGNFWNVFYLMDGEEHKLTRNEIYDEIDPIISHDGSIATFTSMRQGNLEIITYPMNEDELAFRITNSPKPDQEPSFGGSGEYVYWTGRTGNHSYIFKAPGRGGAPVRISSDGVGWEEHPSISYDGRYIAYVSVLRDVDAAIDSDGDSEEDKNFGKYPGMGGGADIPDVEEDEQEEEEVFEGEEIEDLMIWTAEGNYDIWVYDSVTNERTQLTSDLAYDANPCISSDGMVIVFTSDRDGDNEIFMINRDGTGLTQLTFNDVNDDNATIN
jgi:Tol biopolymer transport system component